MQSCPPPCPPHAQPPLTAPAADGPPRTQHPCPQSRCMSPAVVHRLGLDEGTTRVPPCGVVGVLAVGSLPLPGGREAGAPGLQPFRTASVTQAPLGALGVRPGSMARSRLGRSHTRRLDGPVAHWGRPRPPGFGVTGEAAGNIECRLRGRRLSAPWVNAEDRHCWAAGERRPFREKPPGRPALWPPPQGGGSRPDLLHLLVGAGLFPSETLNFISKSQLAYDVMFGVRHGTWILTPSQRPNGPGAVRLFRV